MSAFAYPITAKQVRLWTRSPHSGTGAASLHGKAAIPLTNNPFAREKYPTLTGRLDLRQITRLLLDISANVNVVGLTFAEYMPWDALYLQKMMKSLPIMR